MVEKLAELNRVLIAVSELRDAEGTADVDAVVEYCKGIVIEARIPKHEETISFAQQIGLLATNDTEIRLTFEGAGFIELNSTNQYDLSDEQKKVLLRTCYLHGALREEVRSILKEFSTALDKDVLRWSLYDSSPLPNGWTVDHLSQLGLLQPLKDGWEVASDYAATVSVFLEEGAGWSEEKFREYLKEKEEIGKLGESLVKAYESKRLMDSGCSVEAKCVRNISGLRVNAGYDIESFDAFSPNVAYDRFIEVKGARARQIRFFWSENEINVAKRLGQRYWIYFQGGIDASKKAAKDQPIMIQDPATLILGNGQYKTTPQGLIVESNAKGSSV
jgi:hypothetical protein